MVQPSITKAAPPAKDAEGDANPKGSPIDPEAHRPRQPKTANCFTEMGEKSRFHCACLSGWGAEQVGSRKLLDRSFETTGGEEFAGAVTPHMNRWQIIVFRQAVQRHISPNCPPEVRLARLAAHSPQPRRAPHSLQ